MSIAAPHDVAFLTSIRCRDPETLERLVREYLPQIVRAARAAGLAPHEADDAAQSTFITFLEKAETFEGRSHVRTWLFGILFRKVMEMRRAIGRDRETDEIDDVVESRFNANGSWIRPPQAADAELYARQVREGIDDCLETAPPKQRMAFVLREVEGMTTAEICKILEVTDTNFGVLLYRVRNRLRECLEAKGVRR
ncbi:MAG TPA: sigma-70 family RNA polymerase sigma factor [Thermoanaerobaculia bacterium]|nr:sigma-70 family RNA polymerase sigma factor [Thermoanaerobaculia bacterium]